MSSFFDKDPQCLPKGKEFPASIIENAGKCRVAVLVLSPEFLSSKWPMLELTEIVRAKSSTNPDLAILPLLFKISAKCLSNKLKGRDLLSKWEDFQQEDGRINCDEWFNALNEIRKFNGMEYSEDEGEVAYRDKIVDHVRLLLPPNLKYDDSRVQGRTRLCQEVAKVFEIVERSNGVAVVGLYGIAGIGKATISMGLCNFYSREFKGKVFHAEFKGENYVEIQNQALKVLTDAGENLQNSVASTQQASELLRQRMPKHKVFLAIDNISDRLPSTEAAQSFLRVGFREGSMILLTAGSPVILERVHRTESPCWLTHVPSLKWDEAIAILFKFTHVEMSDLTLAEIEVAIRCITKCCFEGRFHPLALQTFGASLSDEFGDQLSDWNQIPDFSDATGHVEDGVFGIIEKSFRDLTPMCIKIFMLVALYLPFEPMSLDMALGWLAVVCGESIARIRATINNLKNKAFIEEDDLDGYIRVHDLMLEFAERKANETSGSWCCLRAAEEVPIRLMQTLLDHRFGLEAIMLEDCLFQGLPLTNNSGLFANVVVLHLEGMPELTKLNLGSMNVLRSLVILDCEKLGEIEGIEQSSNLAWLEVVGPNLLVKAPQIEGLPALRRFCWDTPKITQLESASVDTSTTTRLGDLRKCVCLEYVDLLCERLEEFPNLEGLVKLQEIHFRDCSRAVNTPDFSRCSHLQYVEFSRCSAMATGPDLRSCSQLQRVRFVKCSAMTTCPDLSGCPQLQEVWFPGCSAMITGPDLSGLSQLRVACFTECSAMTTAPDLSGCSQLQEVLFPGCSAMTTAPDLRECLQLQIVGFEGCCEMTIGPDLSERGLLQKVDFTDCSAMITGPDLSGCSELQDVRFVRCYSMNSSPDFSECSRLREVQFSQCHAMSNGPDLRGRTLLQEIEFRDCYAMIAAPDLSGCSKLRRVWFTGCPAMTTAPDLSGCSHLQQIWFADCSAMTAAPDLRERKLLQEVEFSDCSAMITAPNLSGCSELRRVWFADCSAMASGPDLSGCVQLQNAWFADCPSMTSGPVLSGCPQEYFCLGN